MEEEEVEKEAAIRDSKEVKKSLSNRRELSS
jgi:hypothetical protein